MKTNTETIRAADGHDYVEYIMELAHDAEPAAALDLTTSDRSAPARDDRAGRWADRRILARRYLALASPHEG